MMKSRRVGVPRPGERWRGSECRAPSAISLPFFTDRYVAANSLCQNKFWKETMSIPILSTRIPRRHGLIGRLLGAGVLIAGSVLLAGIFFYVVVLGRIEPIPSPQ
jgi:hypothetical protein